MPIEPNSTIFRISANEIKGLTSKSLRDRFITEEAKITNGSKPKFSDKKLQNLATLIQEINVSFKTRLLLLFYDFLSFVTFKKYNSLFAKGVVVLKEANKSSSLFKSRAFNYDDHDYDLRQRALDILTS